MVVCLPGNLETAEFAGLLCERPQDMNLRDAVGNLAVMEPGREEAGRVEDALGRGGREGLRDKRVDRLVRVVYLGQILELLESVVCIR